MIHILGKIPNSVIVACSGGPDSMAVVDFLLRGKKEVSIAYFDHGTAHGSEALNFVKEYAFSRGINAYLGKITCSPVKGDSLEAHWRNERYNFLNSIERNTPILTCHHLNDQVENWIFTSLHGNPRLIPYRRAPNILRPFLTTRKENFLEWCERHSVPYLIDPSNNNTSFMRNHIRLNVVPQVEVVNPGLQKTIKKKVIKEFDNIWKSR